jgi:nucleoside phosphorylase
MQPDSSPGIVSPKTTTKLRRSVAERVILFALRPHLDGFLARGGARRDGAQWFGGSSYYPPTAPGGPGAVGPIFGAPFAAAIVEELIALGARELVFCGIAGSLVPELAIADVCLATEAFADEAASPAYFPDDHLFTPDPALHTRLTACLTRGGTDTKPGSVWTTSALFRETAERVATHRAAGRTLVEMEISAIFSVAAYHRAAAAGVIVVSDELASGRWRPGMFRPRYRRAMSRVIHLLATWDGT